MDLFRRPLVVADRFSPDADAVLVQGDCLETLRTLPAGSVHLVVTSPPYNIGKIYEERVALDTYLAGFEPREPGGWGESRTSQVMTTFPRLS